jgi:hypothetical protein
LAEASADLSVDVAGIRGVRYSGPTVQNALSAVGVEYR